MKTSAAETPLCLSVGHQSVDAVVISPHWFFLVFPQDAWYCDGHVYGQECGAVKGKS